jgi:hypothetical protein
MREEHASAAQVPAEPERLKPGGPAISKFHQRLRRVTRTAFEIAQAAIGRESGSDSLKNATASNW